MVKGGYQIINFSGVEFTKDTPMQLSNIYDKIEGTDKAILLSGLNVNGIDYRDVMCTPIVIGNSYVIKVFGFRIYISDIDIVRVEDEILDTNWDFNDVSFIVNDNVMSRFVECLYGNYNTFKATQEGIDLYFTVIASKPDSRELYIVVDGAVKNIMLTGANQVEIS